ncbi:hypothetical protein PR048_023650 [Dryococelus australis]|uniref:Uncharacterized protein n=1 Tax=Dryococelus australis TaxID=614101 RepID=A0ABQ9GUR5_9NEOP|nr:hypothetical protein PR048_023650 [Dryococelus australis]
MPRLPALSHSDHMDWPEFDVLTGGPTTSVMWAIRSTSTPAAHHKPKRQCTKCSRVHSSGSAVSTSTSAMSTSADSTLAAHASALRAYVSASKPQASLSWASVPADVSDALNGRPDKPPLIVR